ncbi:MAG: 3-hydroxyacyl-CoA dehydrogenase family protein [Acidobacteriota bacterium]
MTVHTVAVVGAGVMGAGVALDLACYGYRVILKDVSEGILDRARAAIAADFRLLGMMKPRVKALTGDQLLARITFTTSYDGFEKAEVVIENITEDWRAKHALYEELPHVCRPDAIYAVNTSCIAITRVAALMPAPERVIGVHFLNPVPLKPLVEVIRGHHTSDDTVAVVTQFLASLEKTAVVVHDLPGFVTNRVLMLTINESIWVVHDRVAEPKDVDKIFRLGFGHKMGPLATADLIGLDTILRSLLVLFDSYKDSKYRPCPLLCQMVDAGLLGKKSGKGFFEYSA